MKRGKLRALGALSAVALVSMTMSVLPATVAQAQEQNYEVTVGVPLEGVPAESMRFLPDRLTVHQGDTIEFQSASFHTATMLPANVGAQDFIDDNASAIEDPWFAIRPNLDSPDYSLKFNPAMFNPRFDCGTPAAAPCSYDGSEVLDSGVLLFRDDPGTEVDLEGFEVALDVPAGNFFWVFCMVHPEMRMKVTVVADSEPRTTDEEIEAQNRLTLRRDRDAATAAHEKLSDRQTKHRIGNRVVWDAYNGFDLPHVSLLAMYPKVLRIKKGQEVRWHHDQLRFETHTVSLPRDQALDIVNNEPAACDPDDSVAGDETPPSPGPVPCDPGSEFEVGITEEFASLAGNGVVRGPNDFESSGIRGALAPPPAAGFQSYDLEFNKPTGRKGIRYICMIHPFMRGKVVVRR